MVVPAFSSSFCIYEVKAATNKKKNGKAIDFIKDLYLLFLELAPCFDLAAKIMDMNELRNILSVKNEKHWI